MFTSSQRGFTWTLTEASLMLPSPAASLASLLMIGETLVGPYSWILGRQFWYASTTPWISDQKEKKGETHLAANLPPSKKLDNICPIIWAWHLCFFLHRKRNLNDWVIYFTSRNRFRSSTTTCTGQALPSHSSSSWLKFMAKS